MSRRVAYWAGTGHQGAVRAGGGAHNARVFGQHDFDALVVVRGLQQPVAVLRALAIGSRGVVSGGATVEEQAIAVGVGQQGEFGEQEVGIATAGQSVGATVARRPRRHARQEVVADATQNGVGTQATRCCRWC